MRIKGLLKTLQGEDPLETCEPGIEENIRYIEWIMAWYCKQPSLFLANVIVSRLEALRTQERNGELTDSDWACQRLVRNWQYIAERQRRKA